MTASVRPVRESLLTAIFMGISVVSSVLRCQVIKTDTSAFRIRRLSELVDKHFDGNRAALGRVLGHYDGSFVRQMLVGANPITEKTVLKIETLTGLPGWFAEESASSLAATPDSARAPIVPVLGTTITGPQRALDWQEPWSLQHGDRYVEVLVVPPAVRQHAYALRVEGQRLDPWSTEGEWLVVVPTALPCAGDDVVLKTKDGELAVCQLVALYEEHVVVISLTAVVTRTTRQRDHIEFMHPISMRLPKRRGKRHVDKPGYRGADRRVQQLPFDVERRRDTTP